MTTFRAFFVSIALVAMIGCSLRLVPVSAHVKSVLDDEVVEVTLRSSDAKTIKERELYFSIVVVDCEDDRNQFPVQPSVAEQLASDFDFPVAGEFVTFHGSLPRRVLVDIPTPCVFLRGGGYIFGKLESAPMSLVRLAN